MKQLSPALAAHLAGPVTTLATCWALTRRDGVEFHFTDHDRDLTFEGKTYLARFGTSRTALSSDASFSVDSLDVDGFFDSAAITEGDLRAGLFDFAQVRVFAINWADPGMGALRLRRGWLGEVTISEQGQFRSELRGLTQALQQEIGALFSAECRADLGDARCGVVLGPLSRNGLVTAVSNRTTFTASLSGPAVSADAFTGGLVSWTSGPNTGRAIEIKSWDLTAGRFELYLPPGYGVEAGHSFTAAPGCDKRLVTCRTRFGNVLNFRGEPYVPGMDSVLSYPDAG